MFAWTAGACDSGSKALTQGKLSSSPWLRLGARACVLGCFAVLRQLYDVYHPENVDQSKREGS